MIAIQGYYDGLIIKPLEDFSAKPNQKVIITLMDEFISPPKPKKLMRGVLAQYGNPELRKKEEGAWEHATVEQYDNV